ncbi:hypothetical protein ACMFMF_010016 [Clarireedia jacksonii]
MAEPASPARAIYDLQNELNAARVRTQQRAEQEVRYRDERDRHFNRLLDIQSQIQACVGDLEGPTNDVVSVEDFISAVRRIVHEFKLKQIDYPEHTIQEIDGFRKDMQQLYKLVEAAAREVGMYPSDVQTYIRDSVNMIKALQQEVRQREVSSENREGARVITQLNQERRGVWDGRLPADSGVIPSSVGAVNTRNLAAPITYDAFKAIIWPIYLGLFDSERTLRMILIDRNIEVPIWSSPPPRADSENIPRFNRWDLGAHLVTKEVERFYFRVLSLWHKVREEAIPGSEDDWNGPYDDDNGRAYHVHEVIQGTRGRGLFAEQEIKLMRQFLDPITNMGRKTDLDERHERRWPIYQDLQNSISIITNRIVMFRQVPPAWPEQHERDNTATEPKRDYDLLALMLTRIELEYLSLRLKQLLETVNSYWHLIPHGDATMIREMAAETSQATGVRIACEAELTRPSEIAPAPAYPGRTLPPYDQYIPYGRLLGSGNQSFGGKNEKGNKWDKNRGDSKDQGSGKKGVDNQKKQQSNLKARINQMQKLLKEGRIQYKHKQCTGNFASTTNGASEWEKLTAENKFLTTYKNELESAWKKANSGKKPPPWPKH